MPQFSVAEEPAGNQRVVSQPLIQQPQSSRGDGPQQREYPTGQRSPTLQTAEVRDQQSRAKAPDILKPSEETTSLLSSFERFWIKKNEDDDEMDDESTQPIAHSLSLQRLNENLNLDQGPLSENQKNQAFLAYIVAIDPSVQDLLRAIETLHRKRVRLFMSDPHFSRSKEYQQSLKTYVTCRKKYYRQYKTNEEQRRAMVQTVRESLATLRDCLLERYFASFAQTEQGREIALLEEQARTIYERATDEIRAKIDQQGDLYADYLSQRNAFLLNWNRPEDEREQKPYTEQELVSLDHMKRSLQHYLDLSLQEMQTSSDPSLDDEELLESLFERFAQTEQGREIAQLEEQAREVYWATIDHLPEQSHQANDSSYANFLAHRNAFLRTWHKRQGEKRQAKYTAQQRRHLDGMKKSLHHSIESYKQEMKQSYEHALADEALLHRLIRTLHTSDHPQARKVLRSNGLLIKRLFEEVASLHKSFDEPWHDHPHLQHHHPALQEEYAKKYDACINTIDQFNRLEKLEDALKVVVILTDIRRFLLQKLSETLLLTNGKEGETASPQEQESDVPQRQPVQLQARAESHQDSPLEEREAAALEHTFAAMFRNEEGKHIDRYLEEITLYVRMNKYLEIIAERELDTFENKKNKIFEDYGAFLESPKSFKKRQMRELRDQLLIAKIKIEARLYLLFLHHEAGQATQQLEEKYRVFTDTIDLLFQTIPLDLQNSLRAPSKDYNAAKADLVKLLADSERSAEHVNSSIERLNRSLVEQITAMKEKIWSQFRTIWYESGARKEMMDYLVEQGQYQQGELESYIENILELSQKIDDRLYQHNAFRQALRIQFAYKSHDPQSVYEQLILLHNGMASNSSI